MNIKQNNEYLYPYKRQEETIINSPSLESYNEMLDELTDPFQIGSLSYDASFVLEEVDPIAYDMGYSDYCDTDTTYTCPICSTEYDTEQEADACCLWQCPICLSYHKNREDAFYCCQEMPDDSLLQEEIEKRLSRL